jgi:hypothetical protein
MADREPDRIYIGGCYRCKEPMWLSATTYETLKRSSQTFRCPWGHEQHFPLGKSEAQKLQEELDRERRRRQTAEQNIEWESQQRKQAERSATAYKGQATRLRNRAKSGVCPCCNRTVSQLARHMASKHPDFVIDADAGLREGEPPILSLVEGGRG